MSVIVNPTETPIANNSEITVIKKPSKNEITSMFVVFGGFFVIFIISDSAWLSYERLY